MHKNLDRGPEPAKHRDGPRSMAPRIRISYEWVVSGLLTNRQRRADYEVVSASAITIFQQLSLFLPVVLRCY